VRKRLETKGLGVKVDLEMRPKCAEVIENTGFNSRTDCTRLAEVKENKDIGIANSPEQMHGLTGLTGELPKMRRTEATYRRNYSGWI
jgi:hypothetical protein